MNVFLISTYVEKHAVVVKIMESRRANKDDNNDGFTISTLECPVCLDVWKGAIFKCDNGHIICVRCLRKLAPKKCPTCRQEQFHKSIIDLRAFYRVIHS